MLKPFQLLLKRRSSGSTQRSLQMSELVALSVMLSTATVQRKLISAACIHDLTLSVITQLSLHHDSLVQ